MNIEAYLTSIGHSSVQDEISRYFDVENLGTIPHANLKFSNCEKDVNPDITIKEQRELKLINDGLNYDMEQRRWTVTYPWIKDP